MIGLGVDLVELDRFRAALARTPSLVDRVFTPAEQVYAVRRRDPTERFAVRFAAKEATLKAMGVGLFSVPLTDIEVLRAETGEPRLRLLGKAAVVARERGIAEWRLSLTHTEHLAQAVVAAFGPVGLAAETTRARTVLAAADSEATVRFYEEVLGFRRTGRDPLLPGGLRVALGGTVMIIAPSGEVARRVRGNEPSDRASVTTVLLIEVADPGKVSERARRHGVPTHVLPGTKSSFTVMDLSLIHI
ncbi:MAG: holo-ACP synthase, partial [Acidimicrobiales bacterium]|nr:holo-ACP synthase [Acidimicrobiales bacterium]